MCVPWRAVWEHSVWLEVCISWAGFMEIDSWWPHVVLVLSPGMRGLSCLLSAGPNCRWEVQHSSVQLSLEVLTLNSSPVLYQTTSGPTRQGRWTVLYVKPFKEAKQHVISKYFGGSFPSIPTLLEEFYSNLLQIRITQITVRWTWKLVFLLNAVHCAYVSPILAEIFCSIA